MRSTIIAAALALASGHALASSIEPIGQAPAASDSIVQINCTGCPPLVNVKLKKTYRVPVLTDGVQQVELRESDGKREIIRTDAWMGGSPVTFVSSSTAWFDKAGNATVAGLPAPAPATMPADGIDATARTAALPPAEPVFAPPTLDAENFQLRLN